MAGDRGNSSRSRIAVVRFLFEGWTGVQVVDPDVVTRYSLRLPPPDLHDLVNDRTRQRLAHRASYAQGVHGGQDSHRLPVPLQRHLVVRVGQCLDSPQGAERRVQSGTNPLPRIHVFAVDDSSLHLITHPLAMSACISASRGIDPVRRIFLRPAPIDRRVFFSWFLDAGPAPLSITPACRQMREEG